MFRKNGRNCFRAAPTFAQGQVLVVVLLLGALAAILAAGPAQAAAGQARSLAQGAGRSAPAGFWEAIELDDVDKLEIEMLRGAAANARHPEHGPAIVVAARERSPKVLAYLARLSGTAIDATNANGETALMLVALHGDLTSVQLLVERGAEVNRSGWTPLHYAASGGHVSLVEYLLEQHAYIDAQSPNRTTPLMMAARHKHTNVVHQLVEAGADPTPRNEAGLTAADYMAANGEQGEAQWLNAKAAEFAARYGTAEAPHEAAVQRPEESARAARPDVPGVRPEAPVEVQPVPFRLPGARD